MFGAGECVTCPARSLTQPSHSDGQPGPGGGFLGVVGPLEWARDLQAEEKESPQQAGHGLGTEHRA